METFSSRLKELRLEKGLSQTKVAEKLGVSYFTIGKWENNKAEPSLEVLNKIADIFEVSADYLIGREDDFAVKTQNTKTLNQRNITKSDSEMLSLMDKLSPFAREAVLIQIRALAKETEK